MSWVLINETNSEFGAGKTKITTLALELGESGGCLVKTLTKVGKGEAAEFTVHLPDMHVVQRGGVAHLVDVQTFISEGGVYTDDLPEGSPVAEDQGYR